MNDRRDDPGCFRRSRRGRVLVAWIVAVAMSVVAAAALLLALRVHRQREKETIDRFAVVEAVRKILRVATIEMQVAEVVTYREARPFLWFFTSEKDAVIRVRGKVTAGFDLTSERVDIRIDEATRRVVIRLPRAAVMSIDPTIEILDESSGWRNPVTREDRNLWLRWARGDLRRAALDSRILEQAESHARELMTSFAGSWGYGLDVTFEGQPEPVPDPGSIAVEPKG